jgi:iron complex outermembrane receptor protein
MNTKKRSKFSISKGRQKFCYISALSLLPFIYTPQIVLGQEPNALQIEEIVVSARRRDESSQDIPISILAFTGDEMKLRNMTTGRDIGIMVPNLVIGAGSLGQQDTSLRIRGVPGVGIYLDGVWQGSRGVLQTNLVELQRVEVLRGPQGTLFGRNTNGGAIQYVSVLPSQEMGASFEMGTGSFDSKDIKVSIDLPLTDTILTKWTAARFEREGYLKSVSTRDLPGTRYDDRNDTFFRGDILWQPNDDFGARLTVFKADQIGTEGRQVRFSNQSEAPWFNNVHIKALNWLMTQPDRDYPSPQFTPQYYEVGFPGGDVGEWETKATQPSDSSENNAKDVTLRLNWAINDNLEIESLTASRTEFAHQLSLQDGADFVACCRDNRYYDDELFSQEFHLTGSFWDDKASFLVGGYYSDAENKARLYRWWMTEWLLPDANGDGNPETNVALMDAVHAYGASIGDSQLAGYRPLTFLNARANHAWTQTDEEEKAIFGEVDWNINDQLKLTLGARWSWRDVITNQHAPGLNDAPALFLGDPLRSPTEGNVIGPGDMWAGPIVPPARPGINVVDINSSFTPKIALNYQLDEDILLYGSYSEGFSEGGVSYVSALDQLFTLAPEVVESTEIGIKSYLMDRSIRLNANAFFSTWNNLRVSRHPIDPNTGLELPTPFNTDDGSAEVSGFEVEVLWFITNQFSLNFNGGYLKTEYIDIGDPDVSSLSFDAPFAFAPKKSYSVGAQYAMDISNDGELIMRVDYGWKDEYERDSSIFRHREVGPEPSYGLLNLHARYTKIVDNGEWSVALWGSNLTNEHYIDGGFVSAGLGISLDTVGPPREYGITLEYGF